MAGPPAKRQTSEAFWATSLRHQDPALFNYRYTLDPADNPYYNGALSDLEIPSYFTDRASTGPSTRRIVKKRSKKNALLHFAIECPKARSYLARKDSLLTCTPRLRRARAACGTKRHTAAHCARGRQHRVDERVPRIPTHTSVGGESESTSRHISPESI